MASITDTGDEFQDDPAGEREVYGEDGRPVEYKQDREAYIAEELALAKAEAEAEDLGFHFFWQGE